MTTSQKILLILLRALVRALASIPFALRRRIGFLLGCMLSLLPTRDRKIAKLQLRTFLKEDVRWYTIPCVYGHLGQTLFESLDLAQVLRNPEKYITCHGLEEAKRSMNKDSGVIALTAHTGNWDVLAAFIVQSGFRLYTAGRQARSPVLQALLVEFRQKYGIETIWRSSRGLARGLVEALQAKAIVAALIDQDTRVSGALIPFFGRLAFTPTGLIKIGKLHNASFVSAFIFRTKGRFDIFIDFIDPSLPEEDIAAEYNRRLESHLRQRPSQWVWFHKRWRTVGSDVRLSSQEYIRELEALESKGALE